MTDPRGRGADECVDRPGEMRSGEELNRAALEAFLRSHFPDQRGELGLAQYPSGHSNLTYLVTLGGREMVLRRPPYGSTVKSAHDMGREFRVLSKLHDAYPLAPKVILYSEDQSILGAPFYLMEPTHGVILRRDPPRSMDFSPAVSRRLCKAFVANLAELHRLDYDAIGLGALGNPDGYLERQIKGWTARYEAAKTDEYPEIARLAWWMAAHMPASGAPSLIHNDYKFDNAVLDPSDPSRMIGLLDWEMCTIGDPLTDLGTLLAYWVDNSDPTELVDIRWGPTNFPGSYTRREIVDAYAELTGRDTSQLVFYLVFARFKLIGILQQIYYRYHHGLTHDERFAAIPARMQVLLRAAIRAMETNEL